MCLIHHRIFSVAFGIGIPQDTFLFKPSLYPSHFILCTNNLFKKIFFFLTIFCQTLKAEERSHLSV